VTMPRTQQNNIPSNSSHHRNDNMIQYGLHWFWEKSNSLMRALFSFNGSYRLVVFLAAAVVVGGAIFMIISSRTSLWANEDQAIQIAALDKRAKAKSGKPIPRFVSLKKGRVNVRRGPSKDYQVAWVFVRKDLPIEIIAEFEQWRRIRDNDGAEGWIFHSLLTGKRTALITPWRPKEDTVKLYEAKGKTDAVVALVQPGAMGKVTSCDGTWCQFSSQGYAGWLPQKMLWGVYPGENF